MHCKNCNYYLGSYTTGSRVCPQCLHVNHLSHPEHVAHQGHAAHHTHSAHAEHHNPHHPAKRHPLHPKKIAHHVRRHHHHIKLISISFGLAFIFLFIGLLSFFAQNGLLNARRLDQSGYYTKASEALQKTPKVFIWPGVKNNLALESASNGRWLIYSGYQNQAENLIKQGKFNESLALLHKIPKDYPTFSIVAADIDTINQQLAAIPPPKTTPAKQAVPKKVIPVIAAVPRPSLPQASSGCSAPTTITGKRYTDISNFALVQNAATAAQVQQLLQNFFDHYGLKVEITSVDPDSRFISLTSVTYDQASDADICNLRASAMMLIDEWSKYPTDWVRNSKLNTIVLVKNIKRVYSGNPYPVAATYNTYNSEMWYDIKYGGDYMREVIHHEFFHMLVYNYTLSSAYDIDNWTALNLPGFTYGSGGASCYIPGNNCLTGEHPIPGFVTGYGAASVAEDQAETYAYLMTDTYYHHLQSWLPSDPALSDKVNSEKTFIASHSSSMDNAYFAAINP